jgi:hypothetical protein
MIGDLEQATAGNELANIGKIIGGEVTGVVGGAVRVLLLLLMTVLLLGLKGLGKLRVRSMAG